MSRKHGRKLQGHPARVAARKRRQGPPDERELERRRIVALMNQHIALGGDDPALVAPLAAAAERAAEMICADTPGLDDHEHRCAVPNYLTEQLAATLGGFLVADYLRWRREGLRSAEQVHTDGADEPLVAEEADAA